LDGGGAGSSGGGEASPSGGVADDLLGLVDGLVAGGAVSPLAVGGVAATVVALLPRAGWLAAALACVVVLAGPHPDAAALVAIAVAVPPLLLPRSGLAWSLLVAAPVLGLAGLAGAYPALAGRVGGLWERAALGAAGMCWLLLAEPLLHRELVFGSDSLEDVATSGALLLAPVWAVAAAVLPWLVPRSRLPVALAGAAVWAAGLAAASAALAEQAGLPEPRALAAGAVAAGALAVLGARPRDTVKTGHDPVRTGI
jgi:hypothetical protein